MLMKIMLTGFEPFGERAVNTSFEAVLRVKDTEDIEIKKKIGIRDGKRYKKTLFENII